MQHNAIYLKGCANSQSIGNNGVQTLLKAGCETIKENATVTNVIKCTLKTTVGAVLNATVDQIAKTAY